MSSPRSDVRFPTDVHVNTPVSAPARLVGKRANPITDYVIHEGIKRSKALRYFGTFFPPKSVEVTRRSSGRRTVWATLNLWPSTTTHPGSVVAYDHFSAVAVHVRARSSGRLTLFRPLRRARLVRNTARFNSASPVVVDRNNRISFERLSMAR